jgi:glycogen debranching enzyme
VRVRRTLKHDDTFAILDAHGDIGVASGGPDGVFHQDTRRLSYWCLAINGHYPLLLGSDILSDNAGLIANLTNPDFFVDGRVVLAKDTLAIVRFLFVWNGSLHQRISVQNFDSEPTEADLSLAFDSDFVDIFEVRGVQPRVRGSRGRPEVNAERVRLSYLAADNAVTTTDILFRPAPDRIDPHAAHFRLTLPPRGRASYFATVVCEPDAEMGRRPFLDGLRRLRRLRRSAAASRARPVSSNANINDVFDQSGADLTMLLTRTPHGMIPYAGIPWYSTTFGRDALITAIETLWVDPGIAHGVLLHLAALQATEDDPQSDAQPGKILHETRAGEMARLGEVPFRHYYGSVDATPLYVLLAGLYYRHTGDTELLRRIWPNIEAALGWIDGPGDVDEDGFVEYFRSAETGLSNQGWKDSHDAIFHADGKLAEGPIALVEVQAYVFAAKRAISEAARALGLEGMADRLNRQAVALAARFEETFWSDRLATYVVALDGRKRQCEVASSNAGHALFAGIADNHRAELVARRLMAFDSFSGWGIRTVSRDSARYNPMSYHNGSVWPHDNAIIALGFARYGLHRAVERTAEAMLNAACWMESSRLPELFCGFKRRPRYGPTLYPVACAPQAWASAAPFALLSACLGLEFIPAEQQVRLHKPRLTSLMDQLSVHNIRIGDTILDIEVARREDHISVSLKRREGPGGAVLVM